MLAVGALAIFARPLLQWGAESRSRLVVRLILALRPAIADSPFSDKTTPLEFALESRDLELLSLLLAAGAEPNGRFAGETPVVQAAIAGDVAATRALLEAGGNPNETAGGRWPLLFFAARLASESFLPNGGYSAHDRPRATRTERLEIVELLLNFGADPDAKGDGMTPLQLVAYNAVLPVAAESGQAPDTSSAFDGLFDLLLRGGADPNGVAPGADSNPDPRLQPPLHLAVGAGRVDLIEKLLVYGANPDLPDRVGRTALALALSGRQSSAAIALLRGGASPAAMAGDLVFPADFVYRRLLGRPFDPNHIRWIFEPVAPVVENAEGEPVEAWKKEDAEVLKKMILGAMTFDHSLDSALHWAVRQRDAELAAKLAKAGARLDLENGGADTPRRLARRLGFDEIEELLADAEAGLATAVNAPSK